eukprot:m.118336 g.118336  ORF g.118336 m.118336 type:complete len:306 (-) comp21719_c0_seq1:196-1113(-)
MDTKAYNSPRIQDIMATWDAKNPGLLHTVQNDSEADVFIRTTFTSEVYGVYAAFELPVMKADMWRYAVLYARGGVYADADAECVQPTQSWWSPDECDAAIGYEDDNRLCNWAFASAPRHPVFARALVTIIERVHAYRAKWGAGVALSTHSGRHFVHHFTGPSVFTSAVQSLLGINGLPDPGHTFQIPGGPTNGSNGTSTPTSTVCIQPKKILNGEKVRNHYGSLWMDEAKSWTKQRDQLRRKLCADRGGDPSTYTKGCEVEYCCGACHGQHACGDLLHCACVNHDNLDHPLHESRLKFVNSPQPF